MTEFISAYLVLSGSILTLIGSIGLLRFPDVFCRGHALTKSMTLGAVLLFLGGLVFFGLHHESLKLLIALVFQFLTIPLSGHILGMVAYRKKVKRYKK